MSHFEYRQIDAVFVREATDRVIDGESVFLRGPRFLGKRYALEAMRQRLLSAHGIGVVSVLSLEAKKGESEPILVLRDYARDGVPAEPGPRCFSRTDAVTELPRLIEERSKAAPTVLMGADLDALPYHLGNRLLQEARRLVAKSALVLVMSGEGELGDLLIGPEEWPGRSHFYAMKGLGEQEFRKLARSYLDQIKLRLASPDGFLSYLWRETGGNFHLMRAVVWGVIEGRLWSGEERSERISVPEAREYVGHVVAFPPEESQVLRYVVDRIAAAPDCLANLRQLTCGEEAAVDQADGPPTTLELAGLAIRDGKRLVFASPIMTRFARRHYDDQEFGRLYALNGMWTEAFQYFERQGKRPRGEGGLADLRQARTLLPALASALHIAATQSTANVVDLFVRGSRHVLGFREAILWKDDLGWRYLGGDEPSGDRATAWLHDVFDKLPLPGADAIVPLQPPWDETAVAASLLTQQPEGRIVATLSDGDLDLRIPPARQVLAVELLKHFREAYEHARSVEWGVTQQENVLAQAAEQATVMAAHSLGNQLFAPLPALFSRYQRLERECPALRGDNELFESLLREMSQTFARTREHLGQVVVRVQDFDLKKLLESLLGSHLNPGAYEVRAPAEELPVRLDPYLLGHAFEELIHNSREMADKPDKLFVWVEAGTRRARESPRPPKNLGASGSIPGKGANEEIVVRYWDNGRGVPGAMKEKLFTIFFSYRPGRNPGLGMGLWFVRRVVEAHHGSISEQGSPNRGVEFVMVLPRFLGLPGESWE